jgi:hypothetical protein
MREPNLKMGISGNFEQGMGKIVGKNQLPSGI